LRANHDRGNKVLNESQGRLDTSGRNSCRYVITLGKHEISETCAIYHSHVTPSQWMAKKIVRHVLRYRVVIIAFASCHSYKIW